MSYSSLFKQLASTIPIAGAFFLETDNKSKAKRFVTDTSKFLFGILVMTLSKHLKDAQSDMAMSADKKYSDDPSTMSMQISLSMFLLMYAKMRGGAMIGELVANQTTRCCTEKPNENTWREHEFFKNWVSTVPIAGSFVKHNSKKHMVHDAAMNVGMYALGTAAMMFSFGLFEDSPLEEPMSIFRMYIGMAVGMVSVMATFIFLEKIISLLFSNDCNSANNESEQSYQQIP